MKKRGSRKLDYASPDPRRAGAAGWGGWFDRRWLAACCAVVALITAVGYAGDYWSRLAYWLISDGAILCAWLLAGTGFGWTLVRRHPGGPSSLRLVTAAALGLGMIGLLVLGLGLIGWLNRVVAWVIVGPGAALCLFWLARALRIAARAEEINRWWRAPARWEVLWLVAMPFLGMALFGALAPPGVLWQDEPAGYDVTSYHLQVPREWHDGGRITGLRHNVFSYMPMGVEVHYLMAMHLCGGPYEGMYLAQLMHVAFVGLAIWAAAACAGAICDHHCAAPLAGAAMAAVPWLTALGPIAYNEGGLLLYGALAIGWSIIARDWRGWALAGAFAGLACGVKLTAVVMVTGGVVVGWSVALVGTRIARRAPRAERLNVAGVGVFVLSAMVVFAPWMIRNLAWTGNPVFPEAMEVFGKAHFSDVQVERWRRAHSPREDQRNIGKRLVAAWERIAVDWRFGFALLPLAFAAGIVLQDRRALFLGSLVLFQLVVWLTFTHLQGRFFVLAIPAGAILIGLERRKPWPAVAALFILATALVNLRWHVNRFEPIRKNAGLIANPRLQDFVEYRLGLAQGGLPTAEKCILVGDAQAFLYSEVPTDRLRYRTVFDVPPPPTEGDWLGAWAGDGRGLVLVYPGELARFKRTYYAVPAPSDAELEARPLPYGIQRK